jgi:hypothetical protein
MRNIGHLPDELWLIILEHYQDEPSVRNSCERLVMLGNLSMTSRRLRNLVRPMLEEAMSALIADDEYEASPHRSPLTTWLLVEFLHAIRQCPMLVRYVRTLHPTLTMLDRATWTSPMTRRFAELRPFGQKALRSLGVTDDFEEWHSPEGWIALLLLMLPRLERIKWTGEGGVGISSPLRRMVDIAKEQTPPKSFQSLKAVSLDCRHPTVPDALKWDFLVLPSVEVIQGLECRPLADRLHISPDFRRISITTFRSGGQPLPMHLLEEKFRRMSGVRSFQYRYSLHHNGGFVQMMALTHTLRQLHRSLEEVSIEPLTPASSSIRRSRTRTSPHMWKRLSEEQPVGNLGDAGWLLGSLTGFERLQVVRAPHTALYDPRYVVALKHLLPRSLQHLDITPGPTPHKLDAAMLTTQLVAMVRSKPERFPQFVKLTIGDHATLCTPLLRDISAKFGVEIETSSRSTKVAPDVQEGADTEPAVTMGRASAMVAKRQGNVAMLNTQNNAAVSKVRASVIVVEMDTKTRDATAT